VRELTNSRIPKVIHIVPALFRAEDGVIGGAERYAFELARNMADVVPTTLVSFGIKNSEENFGLLKVKVLGNAHFIRGQRTNPISVSLLEALSDVDIVHCHQQHVVASSAAAVTCRVARRKVFVSDLGGGGWDISGYFSTDRWYNGHLHISEYSRTLSKQLKDPHAHVIWGGVDTEKFSPDPRPSRSDRVLFVGRLLPHKGVNYLIEGLPGGMPLSIVGRPYNEKFFYDLQALATGKNITFYADFDDAALVRAYRSAMCVVLPSVYTDVYGGTTQVPELLGQTLLEGMACGLPAICTSVASMPEIVVDGVTGFVVPPNDSKALSDKIAWLRDHPERARAMGEAARLHILDKFTWPRVVQRCLNIYRS
jgi:glycosyltransferase involved in cell wall biosynthesis